MKKFWKKLISVALAVVMVIGMVPTLGLLPEAAAAGTGAATVTTVEDGQTVTTSCATFKEAWSKAYAAGTATVKLYATTSFDIYGDYAGIDNTRRLLVDGDRDITLDLNGYELYSQDDQYHYFGNNNQVFRLRENGKLTVMDSSEKQLGCIRGAYNRDNGGAVYMDGNSTLVLLSGNIYGNYAWGDGGGIYATGNSNLLILGGKVTDNTADGSGGGIYWTSKGRFVLSDASIVSNTAGAEGDSIFASSDGSDPYLGGMLDVSDLALSDEDANLNNYTENPLSGESRVGISYCAIDEDPNDCITASGSKFTAESLLAFVPSGEGYMLRKQDYGSGNNRWRLHVTRNDHTDAEMALITAAAVKSTYSDGSAAQIDLETRTVTLGVNNSYVTKAMLRSAGIGHIADFSFFTSGSILEDAEVTRNFLETPSVVCCLRTPNGTFEYWTFILEPSGEWPEDVSVAEVLFSPYEDTAFTRSYTNFEDAWAAAVTNGRTTEAGQAGCRLILHADWLAGDNNGNGYIDPNENGGYFSGEGTQNGMLYLSSSLASNIEIDLNGHKIDRLLGGGEAVSNGAVFCMQGGTLVLMDSAGGGTITGGNNANSGGALFLGSGSDLTMKNGVSISGNYAANGGALFMSTQTVFTMENGSITDNSAGLGGAICLSGGGTVNIHAGSISRNTASIKGGAVYNGGNGSVTVHTATFYGNSAKNGGAVYLSSGSLDFRGGYITRNSAAENGGAICAETNGNVTIGDPRFSGNSAAEKGGAIFWKGTGKFQLNGGGFYDNTAKLGAGVYAHEGGSDPYVGGTIQLTENRNTQELPDNFRLGAKSVDLRQNPSLPLSGETQIGISLDLSDEDDGSDQITAPDGGFDTSAYRYFLSDITNYQICKVDGGESAGKDRWQLHFTLWSRAQNAIIGSVEVNPDYAADPSFEFRFSDPHNRVIILRVKNTDAIEAVMMETALGGIAKFYNEAYSHFSSDIDGSGYRLVGLNEVHNFVEEPSRVYQTLTPNGTYEFWTIRVEPETPWDGAGYAASVSVGSSSTDFLTFEDAWLYALEQNAPATLRLNRDWLAGDDNSNCIWDYGEVPGDFVFSSGTDNGRLLLDGSGSVTIDLNGHIISRDLTSAKEHGQIFRLKDSASLTVTDSTGGGSITGSHNDGNGGAFYLSGASSLTLQGGSISGNNAAENGGAVYLCDEASFTMQGGSISGNNAGKNGGAVFSESTGNIAVNGGEICSNSAGSGSGGGIYLSAGSFRMNGGRICCNEALGNDGSKGMGGGIFVTGSALLTTLAGTVEDNTAEREGGGIAFYQTTGSTAVSIGATSITGNSAKKGGGIAFVVGKYSSVSITDAIIRSNSATERGGGIEMDVDSGCHVRLTDSSVRDNSAPIGGGIYCIDGYLHLVDSTITGNTATKHAGGVFLGNEKDIYLGGSLTLTGNTAQGSPSNLYLSAEENNVIDDTSSPLTVAACIGVSAGFDGNDCISDETSRFAIDDGYRFQADDPDYGIALYDNISGNNRYQIHLRKDPGTDQIPVLKNPSLLANFSGGTPELLTEDLTLKLPVNNTYKVILSGISLGEFLRCGTTPNNATLVGAEEVRNFAASPTQRYQLKAGGKNEAGFYSLWNIVITPEGGEWSDVDGCAASVTTATGTKLYYDLEAAYMDALAGSVLPGNATLKLNMDWLAGDENQNGILDSGETANFKYDQGSSEGRLCIDDQDSILTIDLNGHSISRGLTSAKENGQVFRLQAGTLIITDSAGGGSISGGYAEENGGAVYMDGNARLVLNGGSISGSTAKVDGGGVYVTEKASFTMNGGSVSGNSAGSAGGGVYVTERASFTMNGGSISGNTAKNEGGGIYGAKTGDGVTITVNGGSVSGNSAKKGGGIHWFSDDSGRLYLNGGSITGNSASSAGGGVYASEDGTDPYVGGTIRILDNLVGDSANNLYLETADSNLNQNTDNRLRAGARIGVILGYDDSNDYFSASGSYFDETSASFFVADDEDYLVRIKLSGTGGNAYKLYLTKKDSSEATNSVAEIVSALVKSPYVGTQESTFDGNVAALCVDPEFYYIMQGGTLAICDVAELTLSSGADYVDADVLTEPADLVAGVEVQILAPDGITVMTWIVKVVPGSENGTWNSHTLELAEAVTTDENGNVTDGSSFYYQQPVYLRPNSVDDHSFAGWNTVNLSAGDISAFGDDGLYTFTMPANDVSVTALYDSVIGSAAITLEGEVAPGTVPPATGGYIYNETNHGSGDVRVIWKDSSGSEVSGKLDYNQTYTAVVTIDLSTAEGCIVSEAPTATINGLAAEVTDSSRTHLTAELQFVTRKAKLLSFTNSISLNSLNVPESAGSGIQYYDLIADDLPETVPAVTEDANVTELPVTWSPVGSSYTITEQCINVTGTIFPANSPEIDMSGITSFYVTATVYRSPVTEKPVITLSTTDGITEIDISSGTEGATLYYTLDGSDPCDSATRLLYDAEVGAQVLTVPGTRQTVTVKAYAVMDGMHDSAVTTATETVHRPYELSITAESGDGSPIDGLSWTLSGNDGIYQNESIGIRYSIPEGYWVSGISVTGAAYSDNTGSNSFTLSDASGNVSVILTCQPIIGTVRLDEIVLTPGEAFPDAVSYTAFALDGTTPVTGGFTVTVDSWNTSDTTVRYGAAYYPTLRLTVSGNSYCFTEGFTVSCGEDLVYTSASSAYQQTFTLTLQVPKDVVTAVTVPEAITMDQGEALNLPWIVAVTTGGKTITAAAVSWTVPEDFTINTVGEYTFIGSLALPGSVTLPEDPTALGLDADGNVLLQVTVNALPQLGMPSAVSRIEDITTDGVTVRSTVVELSYNGLPGGTIYYTLDGSSPVDSSGKPVSNALVYNYGTGIVLDQDGTHTVAAAVVMDKFLTSDVAVFTFLVDARRIYTLTVRDWVSDNYSLAETLQVAEGEAVVLHSDSSLGLFSGWYLNDETVPAATSASYRCVMPSGDTTVTAAYVARTNVVTLKDITAPVAHTALDRSAAAAVTLSLYDGVRLVEQPVEITWSPADTLAKAGTVYTGTVTLEANEAAGIAFAESVSVSSPAGATAEVIDGSCVITFQMTAQSAKMTADYSIGSNNSLTVANGTSKDAVLARIPGQLTVSTEAGKIAVPAVWDCAAYDGNTPGTYTFTATLDLEGAGIDRNGKNISTDVNIIVLEPEVTFVEIPTANPAPGLYTENQSVTLSAEADAAIYYTTDDTEPTKLSTEYSAPIAVTGTPGDTVTVTVKAIAVKGEVSSSVATFQYTVSLPATPVTVTVEGGSGSGSYIPGEPVTIKANAPAANKYFTGWSIGTDPTIVSTDSTYLFEAPDTAATYKANYADKLVTRLDASVSEPVLGSTLDAVVRYELTFSNGEVSQGSVPASWNPNDGSAKRGSSYTLRTDFSGLDVLFSASPLITLNGEPCTWDSTGSTAIFEFERITSAYTGYAAPAAITNVAEGTAYSDIGLPASVTVTTADGAKVSIGVDWTLPSGSIPANTTVNINGALNDTDLNAAGITGGESVRVSIHVSSRAAKTAAPTAVAQANQGMSGDDYLGSVTVVLSSATNNATVYWTDNDTDYVAYRGPITLSESSTIKAYAAKTGMLDSDTAEFTFNVIPTYTVTVDGGSGSGTYKAGDTVTVRANPLVDHYFTEWTLISGPVSLLDLTAETVTFTMPAESVQLRSNYAPKLSEVELIIPMPEPGEALPTIDSSYLSTEGAQVVSAEWTPEGPVAYATFYTASITLSATEGFAEHGDVYVNGNLVPSVMNDAGQVVVTYQVLSSSDSYQSHNFTAEPITNVPYGTDLSTLRELPTAVTITTTGGHSYTVGILWDFAGSDFDPNNTEAYTFTLSGEIILPAGILGTNPTVSVEISVLAKPYVPEDPGDPDDPGGSDGPNPPSPGLPGFPAAPIAPAEPETPETPDVPCDGGADCPHHAFTDLDPNAWYHEAVDYVLNKGIMNGVSEDRFDPHGVSSRAMIVTMLWRLAEEPVATGTQSFSDIPADQWYTQAVQWAANNGIVEGYDGSFDPNGDITREQLAVILYRYAQYMGCDVSIGESTNILSYNDAEEISDWAVPAIQWAVGSGLMEGDGVNLTPTAKATRCQTAALFMRFCEEILGQ